MRELWGIDDPKVIKQIRRDAARRARCFSYHATGVLVILGAGVAIGIVALWLAIPAWVTGGVAGFVGVDLVMRVHGKSIDAKLPERLRELGRCVQCGYKLDDAGTNTCSECGGRAA